MKKILTVSLICTIFCTTVFAQNESDFKFDGKGTITSYDGWDIDIVIPAQINGVPVTAIGVSVFKNMGITSITLPTSISTINNEALYASGGAGKYTRSYSGGYWIWTKSP
jgi:hypothetical protein